ncbi:MAG: ABC transporter permease [Myxococcales bacterium]|jgi:phospholipid/cholesterol/gamma-HCH transport system permease protein|nr:ABC transporter permease [Myxococcales bacterium]
MAAGTSDRHEEETTPEDERPPEGFLATLGAAGIDLYLGARDMYSVFVRTLYYTARGKKEPGVTAQQMYEIGNKSVFFLTCTMGFIGMILVYQSGLQARRVVPDFTLLGATYLELLVRDLAASIGALMLATRVGAGIAAEIGSMVVTEQIDALRMCAADPIDFLIVPRFKASMVMTITLIVWSGTVAFCSGAVTAFVAFDVPFRTFFNASLVDFGDLSIGVAKCIAYGAAIPVVSGYCGLSTFGGSEGVGWATTRAVVNTSLAIIMLNFFISAAGFIIFPG